MKCVNDYTLALLVREEIRLQHALIEAVQPHLATPKECEGATIESVYDDRSNSTVDGVSRGASLVAIRIRTSTGEAKTLLLSTSLRHGFAEASIDWVVPHEIPFRGRWLAQQVCPDALSAYVRAQEATHARELELRVMHSSLTPEDLRRLAAEREGHETDKHGGHGQ